MSTERTVAGNRPFSARISQQLRRPATPSHAFCVELLDLASVSPIVRPISNSVRRNHPTVSADLRRKPPLIARRTVHHCAPLHVTADSPNRRVAVGLPTPLIAAPRTPDRGLFAPLTLTSSLQDYYSPQEQSIFPEKGLRLPPRRITPKPIEKLACRLLASTTPRHHSETGMMAVPGESALLAGAKSLAPKIMALTARRTGRP